MDYYVHLKLILKPAPAICMQSFIAPLSKMFVFLWRSSFREEKIITPFDDSGRPGICKTLKVGKKAIYHLGKIRLRIINRLYHRCSLVYCSRHESPVLAFELQRKNFSPSLLKSAG